MSEISNAIQEKCLAFGDRIIKLNDYLLEQAANKHQPSAFRPQTSSLRPPSLLLWCSFGVPFGSFRMMSRWSQNDKAD